MRLPVIIAVGCAGRACICVLILYGTLLVASRHVVHQCLPQLVIVGVRLLNLIASCRNRASKGVTVISRA
jgi:hypothetical protein